MYLVITVDFLWFFEVDKILSFLPPLGKSVKVAPGPFFMSYFVNLELL